MVGQGLGKLFLIFKEAFYCERGPDFTVFILYFSFSQQGPPSKKKANEGKSSKKAANAQGAVMRFMKLLTCQSHKN